MSAPDQEELVFVVDVSSFTKNGFIGTTTYGGERLDLEFDDVGEGVLLTSEMAKRIGVKKGAPLAVIVEVEDGKTQFQKTVVAGVGKVARISDAKVYYAVGSEGGAVVRIRRP